MSDIYADIGVKREDYIECYDKVINILGSERLTSDAINKIVETSNLEDTIELRLLVASLVHVAMVIMENKSL